ncbi:unnamed protein product, partial [Brenthis ino]
MHLRIPPDPPGGDVGPPGDAPDDRLLYGVLCCGGINSYPPYRTARCGATRRSGRDGARSLVTRACAVMYEAFHFAPCPNTLWDDHISFVHNFQTSWYLYLKLQLSRFAGNLSRMPAVLAPPPPPLHPAAPSPPVEMRDES